MFSWCSFLSPPSPYWSHWRIFGGRHIAEEMSLFNPLNYSCLSTRICQLGGSRGGCIVDSEVEEIYGVRGWLKSRGSLFWSSPTPRFSLHYLHHQQQHQPWNGNNKHHLRFCSSQGLRICEPILRSMGILPSDWRIR